MRALSQHSSSLDFTVYKFSIQVHSRDEIIGGLNSLLLNSAATIYPQAPLHFQHQKHPYVPRPNPNLRIQKTRTM